MQPKPVEEQPDAGYAHLSSKYAVPAMYVAGGLAPFLVFVLPLFVPTPPARAISSSYLAGSSNRVAILSAVGLSVLMLVLSWCARRQPGHGAAGWAASRRLPKALVVGVIAATAVVQIFAGWMITVSRQRNLGDAGYIIEQATVRADTGRALYTQIEFAYGPLLLYPEIWLSRLLGCSISSAYFALLVVESALGLMMLAYILDHLPIRSPLRKAAFVLLAIAAITPHFGMNYTLFRFAGPLFVLLWGTRRQSPWQATAWLTAGMVLELLTSPELGLVLACGVITYGVVRAVQSDWRWLRAAVVPVVTMVTLLMTLGRPYLRMAAIFTRGALNLPVGPYPHILLLLFALVWLVPRTLGRRLDLKDEHSAGLLAFYVASIAFMPAALGRCDPLHVMFNGTGIWVLSLMAFEDTSLRAGRVWIACMAFVVLWDHRVNDRLFRYEDAAMVREAILNRLPPKVQTDVVGLLAHKHPYMAYLLTRGTRSEQPLDMSVLEQLVGSATVATPTEISPTVEAQLRHAHLYDPGYFAFWTDTMNVQTEQRVVDYVNAHRYVLIPSWWKQGYLQLPTETGLFQGLNLHYKQRRPVLYYPGELFNQNLKTNWTVVLNFGSYLLYRRTESRVVNQDQVRVEGTTGSLQAH